MEFEQLRAFYILAQTKNFTKAAEMLHIVQSTVTMRIKQLEERVGKPLFIRDKRSVEITQAGLTLLPYAERILKLANEGLNEVSALHPYEDYLSIGSLNSIWSFTLEPILKEYHTRYPEIAIRTKTGHSSDVVQYLLDNLVQLGIVYIPPTLPNFEVIPCYDDEIILIGAPEHPTTQLQQIDASELSGLPLVYMQWGPPFDGWIRSTLPSSYVPKLQVDKAELAIDLIRENVGVGLVIRSSVKRDLAAGILKEIEIVGNKPPKRSAYIVMPKETKKRPSVEKWLSLMKEFGYTIGN